MKLIPLPLKIVMLIISVVAVLQTFKPSSNLSLLLNKFNNFSPEHKNEPEDVVKSNYYDIDQIQTYCMFIKQKLG